MLTLYPSDERGYSHEGWLESRFSFSFAGYRNPAMMGFHHLRVINEDVIQPGKGFGMHPHHDMEIVTYVISGALEHRDSIGSGSILYPGRVQAMSAGRGVMHSEFNPSPVEPVHLLQIWMFPDKQDLAPKYQETEFSRDSKLNRLCLVGSQNGRDNSIVIHQKVDLYASVLEYGTRLQHSMPEDHHCWIQVVKGELMVNDTTVKEGDGLAVLGERELGFEAPIGQCEFLFFDMA